MKKDRPNQFTSPWQTFAILMAAVFVAEAFVMYLIQPFEDRLGHLFILTLDATLLIVLIAPVLWWLIVSPLRSTAMMERARATTVISNAVDGIITINEHGLVNSFNPGAERIFGYRKEEIVGMPLTSLIPERYREAHRKGLEAARVRGPSEITGKTLEVHGLRKNSGEFPLELTISSWKAGKELFFTAIIRDISERKRIEQEIRLLQSITHAVSEAGEFHAALSITLQKVCDTTGWIYGELWMPGRDGKVLESTPAWYSSAPGLERFRTQSGAFKFAPGVGIPGRVWSSKQPAWVLDVTQELNFARAAMAREAGLKTCMGIPIRADDEVVAVMNFFGFEARAEEQRLIGLVSAVGAQLGQLFQRKLAEEKERKSAERIRALHEIEIAITSTLDLRAILVLLLEKMDLILPYAAGGVRLLDPITGTLGYRALRNIDEKGLAKALEQSRSGLSELVLERKGLVTIHDIRIETRSAVSKFLASRGFVSYLGLPLVAKGETVGVLSVLTKEEHTFSEEEIEFLKALAGLAAMAIHNSQLYEETKGLAIELKHAKELEADFAAMIAHDLRSPLTSVVSTAAMMEDGLFGPVGEEQQRWLAKMQTMCRSLVDLVNDFLDLSKLEAGHVNLQKGIVDLNQLIRSNVEAYLPVASRKNILVFGQVEPNLSAIEADPRRLDQVLHNLISNALKFTPEGGKIEIGAGQEDGTEIKLWVKDTGVGIPAEELGSLFHKYRQTTSGKTSQDKGTGLGLVICKMIVEAHGGRIEVESAPGKGSTFTVRLPVNRQ
jgi:PAS domain S-box-containing protein